MNRTSYILVSMLCGFRKEIISVQFSWMKGTFINDVRGTRITHLRANTLQSKHYYNSLEFGYKKHTSFKAIIGKVN